MLSEDGVEFYKKKTDSSPKGMIPLKGATVISPCQDFSKRTVRKLELKTIIIKRLKIRTFEILSFFFKLTVVLFSHISTENMISKN